MVATAKLKNAEKALQAGKPYWESTKSFFDGIGEHGLTVDAPIDPNKRELLIILASDKGLCGSINSGLVRKTKGNSILLFIFVRPCFLINRFFSLHQKKPKFKSLCIW